LLGLLGTVTGMISTFQHLSIEGASDAQLLSGGISVALITTQLGLIVAVPLLLGHALVARCIEQRRTFFEACRQRLLSTGAEQQHEAHNP